MAEFSQINEEGIVQQVIIAEQEFIDSGAMGDSSNWVQGIGGIGSTYDKTNDVFIRSQPFPSWTLDASFEWQAPTAKPDDGKYYTWNEDTQAWDEVTV
jgi:hypothetical protein